MASLPTDTAGNNFSPDFGFTKQNQSKKKIVRFGDGYEQRLSFGINQNPLTFNFSFSNILEADADILTNFFDAREVDGASFTYQPPTESSPISFVVEGSYKKTIPYAGRAKVVVTFRQVFEP